MNNRAPQVPTNASERLAEYLGSLTGLPADAVEEVGGGRSGSEKYVVTASSARYFVKVANGALSGSRPSKLLVREASVLSQLPCSRAIPSFIDFRKSGDLVVLVSEYVDGTHDTRWTPRSAAAAFGYVVALYAQLADLDVNAPLITEKPSRFTAFHQSHTLTRLHQLPKHQRAWITANIRQLRSMELIGRQNMSTTSILHCDLAVDNLLFRNDDTICLVDWSHAHRGNPLYDLASMLIRVRADSAWSGGVEDILRDTVRNQSDDWRLMMVLAAGSFLQSSAGELHRPSQSLADERLRYSVAGVEWLMRTL